MNLVKLLKGKYPLLGLGLGAEIISLLYGAEITKMKHGHQGANLPVKNLTTDKIEITSQNHFYDIKLKENKNLKITHVNVIDSSVEGFIDEKSKVLGIQYLIQDTLSEEEDVIKRFIKLMK